MAWVDDNLSDNFRLHKDEKFALERPDIEKDNIYLVSKSLDTEKYPRNIFLGYIPLNGLFESESLSFLEDIRFSNSEFAVDIPVSNIKYNPLRFQIYNLFYPFYN